MTRFQRWYASRKAAGVCSRCPQPVDRRGEHRFSRCRDCRIEMARRYRQRPRRAA